MTDIPLSKSSSNRPSPPILSMEQKLELLDLLSEDTNFQIFILVAIYRELTLTELSEKLPKSRATIHRHLQELLDNELILISKQEIIRGHIPANYFQVNMQKIMGIGHISEADVDFIRKTPSQFRKFKQLMVQQTLSSCRLIRNNLKILEDFLMHFEIDNDQMFSKFFNLEQNPTFLSFGLMTITQHDRFMEEFSKFSQEFQQKIIQDQQLQLDDEKPYINFFGIIQMQLLLEHLKKQQ